MNINTIQIVSILIASWFVAFISSYIIVRVVTKWEESNEMEGSRALGAFGIGAFPGAIIWWILGAGAFTDTPVEGIFEIPVVILWIVVLLFAAALGGALVIRR